MLPSESASTRDSTIKDNLQRWFRRAFRPRLDAHTQEIAQVLRSVPFFESFNRRAIRNMADALHVREYRRDEYIYRERDPSLGMYIIQEGRVRLVVEDEDRGVHELRQAGDLDIFGELALFGDFRRLETAQAVTDTVILGFFRPELKTMIKRDPSTVSVLLNALAGFLAHRHMGLYGMLAEKEGRLAAMRMLDAAARFPESHAKGASLIIRP